MSVNANVFWSPEHVGPVPGAGGDGMPRGDFMDADAPIHGTCARHGTSLRNRALQVPRVMAVALSHCTHASVARWLRRSERSRTRNRCSA